MGTVKTHKEMMEEEYKKAHNRQEGIRLTAYGKKAAGQLKKEKEAFLKEKGADVDINAWRKEHWYRYYLPDKAKLVEHKPIEHTDNKGFHEVVSDE